MKSIPLLGYEHPIPYRRDEIEFWSLISVHSQELGHSSPSTPRSYTPWRNVIGGGRLRKAASSSVKGDQEGRFACRRKKAWWYGTLPSREVAR
jgi:hypothetical protein